MKIEKVKFSNINSLAGEYEIDFTHKSLSTAGMFLITGPTGSGKTTILDAICLALYARTPRQADAITRDRNEIMTRGASGFYAEVWFQHGGKRYHGQAKQNIAVGGATPFGVFNHTVAEVLPNGDKCVIEQKKGARKATQVNQITGISFDNFKRSVMLAQGEFDAFLKAGVDEKSAALEAITGTEIYHQIGINAHKKTSELKQRKNQYPIIDGLTEQEYQQLLLEYKQTEAKYQSANELILHLTELIHKVEQVEQSRNEIVNRTDNHNDAVQQLQNFIEQGFRNQLLQGERASRVQAIYATTHQARKRFNELKQNLPLKQKAQENAEAKLNRISNEHQDKMLQLNHRSAANTARRQQLTYEMLPQENMLRELQNTAQERRNQARKAAANLANAQNTRTRAENRLTSAKNALNASQEALQQYHDAAELADILPRLTLSLEQWEQTDGAQAVLPPHETLIQQKNDIENAMDGILQGMSVEDWKTNYRNWRDLNTHARALSQTKQDIKSKQEEVDGINAEIAKLPNPKQLQETAALLQDRVDNIRNLLGIEEKLSVIYQEFLDGKHETCPCCGSPTPGKRQVRSNEELTQAENAAKKAKQEADDAEQKNQALQQRLLRANTQLENLNNQAIQNKQAVDEALQHCHLEELPENTAESFEQMEQQVLQLDNLVTQREQAQQLLAISERRNAFVAELPQTIENLPCSIAEAREFNNRLCDRVETYRQTQLVINQQEQTLATRQVEFENAEDTLSTAKNEANNAQSVFNEAEASAQNALEQFNQQWGIGNTYTALLDLCDKEALKIQNAVDDANATLTQAQQEKNDAQTALTQHTNQLEQARTHQAEEEATLIAALQKEQFANEADYTAAAQFIDRVDNLREQQAQLTLAETTTQAALKEEENRLAQLLQNTKTKVSSDTLKRRQNRLQIIAAQKDNERIDLSNRLHRERDIREQNAVNQAQQDQINQELQLWEELCKVLGTYEKAFQRYAQQITFDSLVYHANTELQNFTERYRLIRNSSKDALGLAVIDRNLGDNVIRDSSNLSGGERFLVSLSLALGLSRMASKTGIDTLFMDEGFGTLDDNTLSQVVSCLESMRANGKLVGIITHVQKLSERIADKLEVQPVADGYSTIKAHPAVSTNQFVHPLIQLAEKNKKEKKPGKDKKSA